jgi:membrane fusion protein, multidrug efflux system
MRKPFGLAAAVLASFTACLMGCAKTESAAIPPSVEVLQVVQKDVPITREWVATLDGLVNAQIRAQVSGILLRQNYTDGAFLRKGTPLFEIDPRPFQAALDQATADLRQAEANLQRGQAELGKTEQDVARYTPLAKESAISQQELDDAVQANLAAKAQVEQQKAAIESARATVESARLNLSFTKILSPLDGIAAIATAQVGDFVGPQSGSLTTVSTVDPILATITPSEQEYLSSVRYIRQQGDSENTALRKLDWQLKLSDGTEFPYKGKFYAIDRQVDIRTGAIRVQIQFPNPGNVLRPGGFGSVSTVTRVLRGALLIPQRAVSELQGGFRSVEMGSKIGGWWIVDEGLKPGDRIVVEGVQKVRDGLIVTPKNYQETPSESAVVQQGNRS